MGNGKLMANKPYELGKSYTYSDFNKEWGEKNPNISSSAYQKYYFSGNDVCIGIVPFYQKNKIIPIPVTDMTFGISQEKVPIYSAFSYTWDAVAKGTRIVRGEFSIVYTEPNHIGRLLGNKLDPDNPIVLGSSSNPVVEVSGEDLVNSKRSLKSQFWGEGDNEIFYDQTDIEYANQANSTANSPYPAIAGTNSAFPFGRKTPPWGYEADYAGHQPFDIIIMFGTTASSRRWSNDSFDGYKSWNEGIVDDNKLQETLNDDVRPVSERIILKNIELMSCGLGLDPSGQPLRESYSFIARDAIIGV
jgi:hypothetical protein